MTTNDNLDPAHVEWSRRHFASIRDGGTWAIPRSGLIFIKRKNELHLMARMPYDPAMPCTAADLRQAQDADFKDTKAHFGAVGVIVIDKSVEPVR